MVGVLLRALPFILSEARARSPRQLGWVASALSKLRVGLYHRGIGPQAVGTCNSFGRPQCLLVAV